MKIWVASKPARRTGRETFWSRSSTRATDHNARNSNRTGKWIVDQEDGTIQRATAYGTIGKAAEGSRTKRNWVLEAQCSRNGPGILQSADDAVVRAYRFLRVYCLPLFDGSPCYRLAIMRLTTTTMIIRYFNSTSQVGKGCWVSPRLGLPLWLVRRLDITNVSDIAREANRDTSFENWKRNKNLIKFQNSKSPLKGSKQAAK